MALHAVSSGASSVPSVRSFFNRHSAAAEEHVAEEHNAEEREAEEHVAEVPSGATGDRSGSPDDDIGRVDDDFGMDWNAPGHEEWNAEDAEDVDADGLPISDFEEDTDDELDDSPALKSKQPVPLMQQLCAAVQRRLREELAGSVQGQASLLHNQHHWQV